MQSRESDVQASIESSIFHAVADIVEQAYETHGIRIEGVSMSWVKYPGGNSFLSELEVKTVFDALKSEKIEKTTASKEVT